MASVNVFLSQEVLVHSHFRFRHTIWGRSGPILISRGRVLTQPRERRERVRHFVHRPTYSGAVCAVITRPPSSLRCTVSTTMPSRPSSKVLPLGKARAFL